MLYVNNIPYHRCIYVCGIISPVLPLPAPLPIREHSAKAMAMTIEEVVLWLQEIKLSKYAELFQEKEVDGEMLAWFTLEDLEEIGVKSGVDRKKIILRFRKI